MKSLRYIFPIFCALLIHVGMAAAQIQIHPLPEHPPAQVLPLGARALTAQDADAWIGAKMSAAVGQHATDSAAVAVVKDGKLLVSRSYGIVDPATGRRMDTSRILFRLGGISQAVTAIAVMQQVAQGKLDLDADINRYLDFRVPPRGGRPLSLRDLLTNASGFDAIQRGAVSSDAASTNSPERFAQWIRQALPPRVVDVGQMPTASDYAVALAGYIVQRVSGQPFAAYAQQHVFDVLGMDHASFEQPLPASMIKTLAATTKRKPFPIHRAAPAQGLTASVADMAHFMIAQLQNGHEGRAQILDFDTVKAMHGYARSFAPGLPKAGLGFIHVERRGQRLLEQRGELPGFHSAILLLPQENVGIFVAVAGRSDGGLVTWATEGFMQRYFPPLPQQKLPTLDTARKHGALLLGAYLSSQRPVEGWRSLGNLWRQSRISMDKSGSLVTPMFLDGAGKPRRWREVQPFVWQDVAASGMLSAQMEQGRLRWVSIDVLMPREAFVPVPLKSRALWNFVLMGAVLLVFVLTVILWLLPAWRRGHARLSLAAQRWALGSGLTALGFLLVAIGWWLALERVAASGLDVWLRVLQVIAALTVFGVLAVIGNAFFSWREHGHTWRKVHATALLLASIGALWLVLGYHLLSLNLHY